jgi:hypothetical protein
MTKHPYTGDLGVAGAKESGFTFPLPTRVEGKNTRGQMFGEETVLSHISHEGSTFHLKNRVSVGERLRLVIDLPEKISADKSLKLVVKGKVAQIEAGDSPAAAQKISVAFDSKYIIKPDE